MARITISLLDSEALSYLQPMQVESISGNLLDEIVYDYVYYIDKSYPTFGNYMNERYHFADTDLGDLSYQQAYTKILNEYVQKD
jgi:hypothetical protein